VHKEYTKRALHRLKKIAASCGQQLLLDRDTLCASRLRFLAPREDRDGESHA
jgi:hypothetical protein